MKRIFNVDIDMNLNQPVNAAVEVVDTLPSLPAADLKNLGRILLYQDPSGDNLIHFWNGSLWMPVSPVSYIGGTKPISTQTTFPEVLATVKIRPSSDFLNGSMSQAHKIKLDKLLDPLDHDGHLPHNDPSSTIYTRDILSSFDLWDDTHRTATRPHGELLQSQLDDDEHMGNLSPSDTDVSSQRAIKAYADAALSGLSRPVKGFDPTDDSQAADPNRFPSYLHGIDGTIKEGDHFIISKTGTINGISVKPNDTLLAKRDMDVDNTSPAGTQYPDNWVIIISLPPVQATTENLGTFYMATKAEVIAGTEAKDAVTPDTLGDFIEAYPYLLKAYSSSATTSITVSHNFNNQFVKVECVNTKSNKKIAAQVLIELNSVTATIADKYNGTDWSVTVIGKRLPLLP